MLSSNQAGKSLVFGQVCNANVLDEAKQVIYTRLPHILVPSEAIAAFE